MNTQLTSFNRRRFVQVCLGGLAATCAPRVARATTAKPFAKSVIEVWVWGGPSQLETFDPKPKASRDYNNGMKAIPTNVPGIEICEWFPKLAQCADKYAIIRTMTHPYRAHETATYLMQTGRPPGGSIVYPAIGAVVAMFKSKTYTGDLPPYVILTVPKGRFSEVGFLGEKYAPLVTGGKAAATVFAVDGITPPGGLSKDHVAERFKFLDKLDTFGRTIDSPEQKAWDAAGDYAKHIITGPAAETFNLKAESKEMSEKYGANELGQMFLAARRLVEAGVPYITINAQGWDSHKRHFQTMRKKSEEMDQAFAALLQDLDDKKLLDTTLVWWSGEFGRGPRIDRAPPWNDGRNHYSACFSAVLAGGGIKGGCVIGESDETASHPIKRPVAPQDLLGTIYERCGIDPDGLLPNEQGIKATVLPPQSKEGRLRELYA